MSDPTRPSVGEGPFVQSPVTRTAARTLTPFVLAYGVYLSLFGTSLPGGAFQGGIVVGAAFVLVGLAFGFGPMRRWIHPGAFAACFLLGIGTFGAVGMGGFFLGGAVLDVLVYPVDVEWIVKLVEVAIAVVIGVIVTGLAIWLSAGVGDGGERE